MVLMHPPGRQGFGQIDEITLFQQVTPHFEIHEAGETFVKSPLRLPPAKHRSGLADEIGVLFQRRDDHFLAVKAAGRARKKSSGASRFR